MKANKINMYNCHMNGMPLGKVLKCTLNQLKNINKFPNSIYIKPNIVSRIDTFNSDNWCEVDLEFRIITTSKDIEIGSSMICYNRGIFYEIENMILINKYICDSYNRERYIILQVKANVRFYKSIKIANQTIDAMDYTNNDIRQIINSSENIKDFKNKMVAYKL